MTDCGWSMRKDTDSLVKYAGKEEHSRVWICGQKWEQLDRFYVISIFTQ